jgi:hypothetical protein
LLPRERKYIQIMSFTDDLFSCLKEASEYRNIREKGKYVTGAAKFPSSAYNKVLGQVERSLEPLLKNGEKIVCSITGGEIIDCGLKQFQVKKGTIIEVYDYSRTTAIFIRLYIISSKDEEWLALYIDENPSTPWWGR